MFDSVPRTNGRGVVRAFDKAMDNKTHPIKNGLIKKILISFTIPVLRGSLERVVLSGAEDKNLWKKN